MKDPQPHRGYDRESTAQRAFPGIFGALGGSARLLHRLRETTTQSRRLMNACQFPAPSPSAKGAAGSVRPDNIPTFPRKPRDLPPRAARNTRLRLPMLVETILRQQRNASGQQHGKTPHTGQTPPQGRWFPKIRRLYRESRSGPGPPASPRRAWRGYSHGGFRPSGHSCPVQQPLACCSGRKRAAATQPTPAA